jgi:hypothetical protein
MVGVRVVDPAGRFLRARKFDVAKAKEMLLAAEQWRRDMKVDEIVQFVRFLFCLRGGSP